MRQSTLFFFSRQNQNTKFLSLQISWKFKLFLGKKIRQILIRADGNVYDEEFTRFDRVDKIVFIILMKCEK